MQRTLLVTGGAGFIGSNFVLRCIARAGTRIVNLDKLTYAGNLQNLQGLGGNPQHIFVRGDINDRELVRSLLREHRPDALVHFAAESHVDRSIVGPDDFIRTNIHGTFSLLEEVRSYLASKDAAPGFRFLHVSTDEVFGSLGPHDPAFRETTPYAPNSPYSASKAAADHLVRAYRETYGLPTLTTNCSNNYGPFQFPEKLIPLMICNALSGERLPIYGDGQNVRDWLYVEDHCGALMEVLSRGEIGGTYNIGGGNEFSNLDLVNKLCSVLDELRPDPAGPYARLISFVKDRPGHDRRYAMDITKIRSELNWTPEHSFESGLRKTAEWYLVNPEWIANVRSGSYRDWVSLNYGKREMQCEA